MCEGYEIPATHLAATREIKGEELLSVLGEFTEIPDTARLVELSRLMSNNKECWKGGGKERFQKVLPTLSVELVRAKCNLLMLEPSLR